MLAMFIGHSLIGHKETRFLLPIFPGFYVLLACFLSRGFSNTLESRNWNVSQRKSFAFVVVIGIVVLTFVSYRITRAREVLYSRSDTSALESAIFEEHPSRRECVLLIEHPVTWTRGELILGGTEELVEKKLKELTPDILGLCRYAIFPDSIRGEFEQRTRGNWVHVEGFSVRALLVQENRGFLKVKTPARDPGGSLCPNPPHSHRKPPDATGCRRRNPLGSAELPRGFPSPRRSRIAARRRLRGWRAARRFRERNRRRVHCRLGGGDPPWEGRRRRDRRPADGRRWRNAGRRRGTCA